MVPLVSSAAAVPVWLGHIGLAAIQVLAWWGAGCLLPERLRTGDRAVDALNRLGLGAVAFALATLFVGLAGLLYGGVVLAATLAAAALGAIRLRAELRGVTLLPIRAWPRVYLAAAATLGVVLLLALVAVGAPVNGYDALYYHVAIPVMYLEQHQIGELAWSWLSYQPFTVEMLIADGIAIWDPVQGAFAPLALVVLATAAVMVAGRLVAGLGVGVLAGVIFFTQPLVAWEGTAAVIDGGLAFAAAMAGLNLLVWVRTARLSALVVAGAFVGAGAGMKYIGLSAAIAFGVTALLIAVTTRRLCPSAVIAFAAPALLVALPWYAKNWILTGNPTYPFLFGGVTEDQHTMAVNAPGKLGFGHSALDILLLPKRLLLDGERFDGADWLSPLVILCPVLALGDRSLRRAAAIVLVGVATFVAIWLAGSSQAARYLFPVLPALALLAAIGLRVVARTGRAGLALASVAAVATVAVGVATFGYYCAQFPRVVFGLESREHFLAKRTGNYDGIRWLNDRIDDGDGVLIDFPSPYLEPRYVQWTPFGLPAEEGPAEKRRFVRTERLQYAAVYHTSEPQYRPTLRALGARRIATVEMHTAFLGVREWGGYPRRMYVYRLSAGG